MIIIIIIESLSKLNYRHHLNCVKKEKKKKMILYVYNIIIIIITLQLYIVPELNLVYKKAKQLSN